MKDELMSDWMAIAEWHRCAEFVRPGIVFELRNAAGQSMFTHCVTPLPPSPFDWNSPAIQFRAVKEPPPERSTPIPPPKGR
jgi:hypothetical protein